MYKCATCDMADPGYCICEVCINTCHEGCDVSLYADRGDTDGIGRGFCDCGAEGSEGKRVCKKLKGMYTVHNFCFNKVSSEIKSGSKTFRQVQKLFMHKKFILFSYPHETW